MTFPSSVLLEPLHLRFAPEPEPEPILAPVLFRVIHDQEAKDGLQRIGLPEVYPMHKSRYCDLTKATEAFTNKKGTETFEDYIRGVNMGTGLPGQEPLICCGNMVKVLGEPER